MINSKNSSKYKSIEKYKTVSKYNKNTSKSLNQDIELLICTAVFLKISFFVYFLKNSVQNSEAAVQMCFVKKVFFQFLQNSQPETCNFIKKETLAQIFSCEFRKIFKSTFFTEHLWWLLLNIHLQSLT